MATTDWNLWVATALMGVSFSLVPAVMWPLTSKLVPAARFGTALGLMWVVQNAGIAGANLMAGWLNDAAGASGGAASEAASGSGGGGKRMNHAGSEAPAPG
jgi:MFS family permease